MPDPTEFISRNDQLWKLIKGEYVLDNQSPSLVYGGLLCENLYLTQSGELLCGDENISGEIKGKVVQFLHNLDHFLVLMEDGNLYHIFPESDKKKPRLIQANVKMIINSMEYYNEHSIGIIILQYLSGQWYSLAYGYGSYCYHNLPYQINERDIPYDIIYNPGQDIPGDEAVSSGRVVTSGGDIFLINTLVHDHLEFGYFNKINVGIKFKIACDLGVIESDNGPTRWFAGISKDDQLYIFDERDLNKEEIKLYPQRSDYTWKELILVLDKYYVINDIDEVWEIAQDWNFFHLYKVDIPPHVINGVSIRIKNSRNR